MKKIIFAAVLAATVCACAPDRSKVTVTVENTLGFDRATELVEIPTDRLAGIALTDGQTYVVNDASGASVPSQVTHDGLLLFQSGLGAGQKANFTVTSGAPGEFAAKTYGRFAPERFDDFIWENDRVAFRIYGAALQPIDGPSNGIDALYKRTDKLILDKWYADALEKGLSYHDDNGTGLDDYKVGHTLGAGAMAPYVNSKIILNSNFTGQELLDNGPLRTTLRLTYPDLALNEDISISDARTISIDAGSQMTRVEQEFGFDFPMSVAAGFPFHARTAPNYSRPRPDVVMVEEPATEKSSGVYLGLVVPQGDSGIRNVLESARNGVAQHILALMFYLPDSPITYYTGFGWEQSGGWTAETFGEYLVNFAAAVETPLVVSIR